MKDRGTKEVTFTERGNHQISVEIGVGVGYNNDINLLFEVNPGDRKS